MTLPKFAVITPTGAVRAIVEGRDVAFRVQDYYQRQDMIPHTIRLATDDDNGVGVFGNT